MIPEEPLYQLLLIAYLGLGSAGAAFFIWARWTTRHWKDRP